MSRALFLNRSVTHLLVRARQVAGMSQEQLGVAMGVSKRTVARREAGRSTFDAQDACRLARLVHAADPAIAAELASAASESLESLGLVAAPAPPPPTHLVVDAVVCAAADALDAAPATVRAALHAAFKRARELRLGVDDVEKALAPVAGGKGAKRPP